MSIDKARLFARQAHAGQLRRSGEPYIIHLDAVEDLLVEAGGDEVLRIAGQLHDIVEDTAITLDQVAAQFGSEVAGLVGPLTKPTDAAAVAAGFSNPEEAHLVTLLLATHLNPGVGIIACADRLHNLRTLTYLSDARRRQLARQSLSCHVPLARLVGRHEWADEMAALARKELG